MGEKPGKNNTFARERYKGSSKRSQGTPEFV
jgi:hypothetical protein